MRLGFALGGGGAKGLAHIGVLKALTRAGIQANYVAGTSVGALVGAVYAANNLHTLEQRAKEIKITDIPLLLSPSWSFQGLFSGKNGLEMLSDVFAVENIEELPIPFAAVSVDLYQAEMVIFSTGNLKQAIRSSIAIPAVFTPVQFQSKLLVDGGLLEPVPVKTARDLGAKFVIAIDLFANPSSPTANAGGSQQDENMITTALGYLKSLTAKLPYGSRLISDSSHTNDNRPIPNIITMIEKTLSLSQRKLTELRMRENPADIVIAPPLSDIGLLDFHRGEAVIKRGEIAAEEIIPQILEALSLHSSN